MAKFTVTYNRKVQTVQYENITVELTAEFDDEETPYWDAWKQVRDKVHEWINNELESMGLSRRPF